jgi:flagellar FliJ protein
MGKKRCNMKKFNFSLQKVLEIKEQLLDNFKIELSGLNNDLKNINDAVENLKRQFRDINQEFVNKSRISISVGEMTYYKLLMESIFKQIEVKEEEKHDIIKKIEAKRQEIVNMNKEITSLEKLKDKELEKHNKEAEKGEEIFIEEFVSNKSMAKNYTI